MRPTIAAFSCVLALALTTTAAAGALGPTNSDAAEAHSVRHAISWQRTRTWHWQNVAGVRHSPTIRGAADPAHSVGYLRWIERRWNSRRLAAYKLAHRPRPATYRSLATYAAGGLRAFAGPCLAAIIDQEDPSWSPTQWNVQGSGAYGLPQALPAGKMASAGPDWRTNPYTQIRWMRGYAIGRYGSECAALAYKRAHGTY